MRKGSFAINYEQNGVTRELNYVTAYGQIVAIFEKTNSGSNMYYVHTDHLGSLNYITDQNQAIEQELSFDAWGNRRDPSTWLNYSTTPSNLITDRGYTGHEHLDVFKLINMNGRVYDPQIGRFLSPDNYSQSPDFTQSYNRYSYCMNNPLSYTNPSGMILMQSAQSWFEGGGGGTFEKAAFHNGSGIGDYFENNSESADSDWGYSGGHNGTPGSQGYSYNYTTHTYTDNATGETVDSDIAISYAINQAGKKGEVEVANITPIYEFQSSYNSSDNAWHVDENGPVPHYYQLVEWKKFDPNSGRSDFNIWGDISNSFLVGAAVNQPIYSHADQIAREGKFAVDGWKTYSNAFMGNQYVSSAAVKEAKATFNTVVKTTARVSTGLTALSVGVTYENYRMGNISEGRFFVQETINTIGLFGPWGAGISIGLGAVDAIWGDQIEDWLRK